MENLPVNIPRILILEDQASDAELEIRELRRAQIEFEFELVDTREAFTKALKDFKPDIILSDFGLPQFNGLEALRLLKELNLDLPFILCTGTLTEEVAVECMKEGATDYILKTSLKRLPSAILNALEKSESRKLKDEAIAALRESEDRYRGLVENTPETIAVHCEGRLVYINCAGVNLLGARSADELIGKSVLDFTPPEYQQLVLACWNQINKGDKPPLTELKITRLDGRTIDVEVIGIPITYQGRKAVQIVIRNNTERKQAERAVMEAESHLRQSQKMEAIGTLTGGVAHDFNNLLTAILGNTQLAFRKINPDDPVRLHLTEVANAANRAAEMTKKLLAFSRRQHLTRRSVNLNDSIADILKLLERIIGADVKVVVNYADDLSAVFADPGLIEQVVMNLMVNARDAMPEGGKVFVETSNVELDEAYCCQYPYVVAPGKYVQIRVTDSGTGIDEETRARIFEPFFTTKEVGKGTGLGLSMAYGIIKQHDGHINLDSEVGTGTTFKIYLPAAMDKKTARETALALVPSFPGGTETILVAEDEESLRNLAKDTLEELGYTVLLAKDGQEAVEIFSANRGRIDLFLSDALMPRMSGSEAYEQIREMGGGNIPLIFMTGYSAETVQSRFVKPRITAEKLGATVIQKPYALEELGRIVRETLDKSSQKVFA